MLYNLNAFQSFPISSFYADYCLERIISHIFLFSYCFWTLCRVLGVALGVATSLCPLPARPLPPWRQQIKTPAVWKICKAGVLLRYLLLICCCSPLSIIIAVSIPVRFQQELRRICLWAKTGATITPAAIPTAASAVLDR